MTYSDVFRAVNDDIVLGVQAIETQSPVLPSIFTLEITTVCNNFCSGCANVELSRSALERKNNIGYMDRWKQIIDKIAALQLPNALIRISGGEPTVHPEFVEIIKYVNASRIPFVVFSTGRWGPGKQQDEIISVLQESEYLIGILVSLHGHDAETHCAFTESVTKSFEETCSTIKKVVAAGILVFTNTVLNKKNICFLEHVVALSNTLGASYAIFNRFIAYQHELLPDKQELIRAIRSIQDLSDRGHACKIGNSLPRCFAPSGSYPAPAGYDLCHVSPDGAVRPDNFSHFSFGNIFEQELVDIWSSDKATYFRESIPPQCLKCSALSICRGGIKSPQFENAQFSDPLLGEPLTAEGMKFIRDDEDKAEPKFRALTSD